MASAYPAREYTAKDVLWRLRDQLQLRSVLAPLTGRYRSKEEIPARVLKIRRRWWWVLNRLRRRGWDVLTGPKSRFKSARECPMTFLMVYGKPRCCHLGIACPFCWARQAAEWWDRVDAAFFKDAVANRRAGRAIKPGDAPVRGPRKARARGYKLVTRTRTCLVGTGYFIRADGVRVLMLRGVYEARLTGVSPIDGPCAWFARVPEIKAGMREIERPGYRSGCFENISADLTPARDAWRVSIRQVWLVPEGRELPVIEPREGVVYVQRVVEDPWRTDVMKAMAQACRYPKAMLTRFMEGAPAHQLVEARRGLRLAANYGDFRNNRLRELGGR